MNGAAAWDIDFKRKLLEASNYVEFLRPFFRSRASSERVSSKYPRPISYAEFSRRAGIASRAYMLDVLTGRKALGVAGAVRVSEALGMSGLWKEYFTELVRRGLDGNTGGHESLDRIRGRLARDLESNPARESRGNGARYLSRHLPLVFAACGTTDAGASIEQIAGRTRLSRVKIEKALTKLAALELVRPENGRFYPQHVHLAVDRLGHDVDFRQEFLEGVDLVRARTHRLATTNEALFFRSTLCVKAAEMSAFTQKLRELLLEFVSEAEFSEGNCVADLVVSFSDNRFDP